MVQFIGGRALLIAGLDPAILVGATEKGGRVKPGHRELGESPPLERRHALARQFVGALVVVMACVALHPVP